MTSSEIITILDTDDEEFLNDPKTRQEALKWDIWDNKPDLEIKTEVTEIEVWDLEKGKEVSPPSIQDPRPINMAQSS
ncbi:hypothetical protein FBU30_002775 [Linnemannia zychae]|nr:hypothetical protein FBU30_002775 [Linnemannia zychae]